MRDLSIIRYNELPGIEALQDIGCNVLALGLVVGIGIECYRVMRGGHVDLYGPAVRCMLGFFLLRTIPTLGAELFEIISSLSKGMGEESKLKLFGEAVGVAMGKTKCETSGLVATMRLLFTVQGWLAMLSSVLYVGMFVVKFLVIDILWPILFGLVVCLGVLSVPIGLFPGMNTIRGWFRNLIEIAVWPLVFEILVSMLATTFPKLIASMSAGEVGFDCGSAVADASGVVATAAVLGEVSANSYIATLQFMAICLGYVVLLLFTPFLCAMVVRGAPVSVVGGIIAAKTSSMMTGALQAASGHLGISKIVSGLSGPGQGRASAPKSAAERLDER
jgi:hypothetical protein